MHDARKLLAAGWRLARQHRSSSWSPPPPPPRPYELVRAGAVCQKRTMPSVYGALGYVKIPPGQRTVDERDCPSLRCPMVVHIRDGREGCHCSSGSSESAEHQQQPTNQELTLRTCGFQLFADLPPPPR